MRASHILVDTIEQANGLKKQIAEGESFAALALDYSKCPSKANGGALGEFGPGMMVKPFEDGVLALEVGGVSEPVQTQFGYHLIHRTG